MLPINEDFCEVSVVRYETQLDEDGLLTPTAETVIIKKMLADIQPKTSGRRAHETGTKYESSYLLISEDVDGVEAGDIVKINGVNRYRIVAEPSHWDTHMEADLEVIK